MYLYKINFMEIMPNNIKSNTRKCKLEALFLKLELSPP